MLWLWYGCLQAVDIGRRKFQSGRICLTVNGGYYQWSWQIVEVPLWGPQARVADRALCCSTTLNDAMRYPAIVH